MIALGAVILQGVLGGLTVIFLLPWWISTAHACLAQLFFSTTVAMAMFIKPGGCAVRQVRPRIWRSLPKHPIRDLSLAAPICVLAQLALGRLRATRQSGSIYHILPRPRSLPARILWISLRILLHYAENRELRVASTGLLAITFCQVFLGLAAFMSRIAYADAVQPMPLMVTFTVLHVAVGALTMAASVALAILVRRNLPAPARDFAVTRATAVS